jgi:H+/Cl- antiporter ClcA
MSGRHGTTSGTGGESAKGEQAKGEPEKKEGSQEARKVPPLFDLRLIIGALFTLYGVILIVTGLADGRTQLAKANGIRINLWAGIGMLITGLLFLLWMRLTGDGHDRAERPTSDPER